MRLQSVDLHLHSNRSDGSDTPAHVVQRAVECGLSAISITDHDTVAGVEEAGRAAEAASLRFISGVEISCEENGGEVHAVGLGIDISNPLLLAAMASLAHARRDRASAMLALLRKQGIVLNLEDIGETGDGPECPTSERGVLCEDAGRSGALGGSIGRMHLAVELQRRGFTRTVQEGFDRFLNPGRPAYVPKQNMRIGDAIACIHEAGGLAFLAHPGLGTHTRRRLPALLSYPFDGIEAYHVTHTPGKTEAYLTLARERGLLVGGGSDCHGTVKGGGAEMGKVRVPYLYFERILESLAARGGPSLET